MLLVNEIKRLREINKNYFKVKMLHPFYFNSIHRSKYFLFGKIFDSIVNQKKIEVGNLDFYRDMVHTKFLVEKAIEADKDMMIGSGKLFNVRDFVIDLYKSFDLDYFHFVKEDLTQISNSKFIRASVNWNYSYDDLLKDTIEDIKNKNNYDK
jgi:GDP-D-mannose dehydratase